MHKAEGGVPFYSVKTLDPVWRPTSPIVIIDSLSLIDQDGQTRTEKMFEGKVSFVAFFFTSCAGFCPFLLQNLKKVETQLKTQYPDIQYVGITVDPEKDSVKNLKAYTKSMKFGSAWKLLTGEEKRIYSFAHDILAAEAFKLPKSKGQVGHSEHFYVIDEKRRLRGVLKGTRLDVVGHAEGLIAQLVTEKTANE